MLYYIMTVISNSPVQKEWPTTKQYSWCVEVASCQLGLLSLIG